MLGATGPGPLRGTKYGLGLGFRCQMQRAVGGIPCFFLTPLSTTFTQSSLLGPPTQFKAPSNPPRPLLLTDCLMQAHNAQVQSGYSYNCQRLPAHACTLPSVLPKVCKTARCSPASAERTVTGTGLAVRGGALGSWMCCCIIHHCAQTLASVRVSCLSPTE